MAIGIMRLKEIDFLRGLAILLVLFHHFNISPILYKIGWMGVDLFFVLSGFLVSGLIFIEFKKNNKIDPKLFLIRRGFKIYPSFFILLIVSFLLDILNDSLDKKEMLKYVCEITFTQNYTSAVWGQTWSLAVEEHFYFFLIAVSYVYIFRKKAISLKEVTSFCIAIFIICLSLRLYTHMVHPQYSYRLHHFPTHLRMDSLLFGVLLAAFYHLENNRFISFFKKYSIPLLIFSFACLSIPFKFEVESYFMSTYGFTILYTGFGVLLALVIANGKIIFYLKKIISRHLFNLISWIGLYSYTIYLFHMLVLKYMKQLVKMETSNFSNFILFGIYFIGSIVVGVFISKLIEIPCLKLREKYFHK